MLRSTSSLVHRRGPVFWFRRSVPVDLIDRLGGSDIRRSLRTCNARVARQRAWTLVLLIEDAFAVLRNAGLTPGARDALNVVLGHVIDDFDRNGAQWSQRLRYQALMETLGIDNSPVEVGGMPSAGIAADTAVADSARVASISTVARPPVGLHEEAARSVMDAIRLASIHPEARKPLTAHIEGAVPGGQAEAARAIGLTSRQSLCEIILPQAFRAAIPPIINVVIALVKSTAVASAFGVAESLSTMEQLANKESSAVVSVLVATGLIYLALTIPLGLLAGQIERNTRSPR